MHSHNTTGAPSASAERPLHKLTVNAANPFYSHRDGIGERLSEASALLTILASCHRDAHAYRNVSEVQVEISLTSMNDEIVASALEGVGTLIALAQHHLENITSTMHQGERA